MIKLDNINNILNLVGKYIRNDKTCETAFVVGVNVYKYKENDSIKYIILNKNSACWTGSEDEIMKILLGWSIL